MRNPAAFAARCALVCSSFFTVLVASCSARDGGPVDGVIPSAGGRSTATPFGPGAGSAAPVGGGGSYNFGNGGGAGVATGSGGSGPPPAPPPSVNEPYVLDDTPASGVPAATLDQLKRGGSACAPRLLYPYADTVFPVGLPAPTLMWDGAVDAAYVRLTIEGRTDVEYQTAGGASAPGALLLGDVPWNAVLARARAPVQATISTVSGGVVSTCPVTFRAAPGKMSGSIFYNTYGAAEAQGNGAVLRLILGETQSHVYTRWTGPLNFMPGTGPCVSCHSVAFGGSTLVAATHDYSKKTFEVWSMPVQAAPQPPPVAKQPNGELGALTPDGARILTMGNPDCTAGADTFPRSSNNFPLVEGPDTAKVRDTKTGQDLAATGLDPASYMWMPQFSPNGDRVVFNHARPDGAGGTNRRELAVMDYDYARNAFSNLRVIVSNLGPEPSLPYRPASSGSGIVPTGMNGCTNGNPASGGVGALDRGSCSGPCYPAYPFFTPDGRGVVFSLTSEPDFAGSFPGRDQSAKSELWYVDVESKQAVPLAHANDEGAGPVQAQFYPTVMPVAVGGQFWMFWTSKRPWGNRVFGNPFAGPMIPGVVIPPIFGGSDAVKKRLWVTALDIAPTPGADPSHPGFYLVGQGDTGNVRAFATLNPCRAKGATCELGLDCCGGFCVGGTCAEAPPPSGPPGRPPCSRDNERCTADADCCTDQPGGRLQCFGGYCGPRVIR